MSFRPRKIELQQDRGAEQFSCSFFPPLRNCCSQSLLKRHACALRHAVLHCSVLRRCVWRVRGWLRTAVEGLGRLVGSLLELLVVVGLRHEVEDGHAERGIGEREGLGGGRRLVSGLRREQSRGKNAQTEGQTVSAPHRAVTIARSPLSHHPRAALLPVCLHLLLTMMKGLDEARKGKPKWGKRSAAERRKTLRMCTAVRSRPPLVISPPVR